MPSNGHKGPDSLEQDPVLKILENIGTIQVLN